MVFHLIIHFLPLFHSLSSWECTVPSLLSSLGLFKDAMATFVMKCQQQVTCNANLFFVLQAKSKVAKDFLCCPTGHFLQNARLVCSDLGPDDLFKHFRLSWH